MAVLTIHPTAWRTRIAEWTNLVDSDPALPWASFPDLPIVVVQLMAIAGTTPSVTIEFSLNNNEDVTKSWIVANDPQGVVIALVLVTDGARVQEPGLLMRPRVTAGASVIARVRMKFSPQA